MVATLLAGYTAPALAGLGAAWLLGSGFAAGLLWALLLFLALMLVQIRNWFGLWVVLVGAAVVVPLTWFAPVVWQQAFGLALTSVLAAGALRAAPSSCRAADAGRRGRGGPPARTPTSWRG